MKIPAYQKAFLLISYLLIGFLAIGSLLDAISNSLSLITPKATYIGSLFLLIIWVFMETFLKYHPIGWIVRGGQRVHLQKLGPKSRMALIGAILLLWTPRVGGLIKGDLQQVPIQEKNVVSSPINVTNANILVNKRDAVARQDDENGGNSISLDGSASIKKLPPFSGGVRELLIPPRSQLNSPLIVETIHVPCMSRNRTLRYYDVYLRNPTNKGVRLIAIWYDSQLGQIDEGGGDMFGEPLFPNWSYTLIYKADHKGRIPLSPPFSIPANGVGAFRLFLKPNLSEKGLEELQSHFHWMNVSLIDHMNQKVATINDRWLEIMAKEDAKDGVIDNKPCIP